jgi:hypothetical protein
MVAALEQKSGRGSPARSSDRQFGLVFAGAFAVIACWPLFHFQPPRWGALVVALIFGVVGLTRPQTLHLLNRVWLALGELLHKIVSPIVMGVIFFCCVTPTAWIMRMRGKDLLSLKWDSKLKSYWTERSPIPANGHSMKDQF